VAGLDGKENWWSNKIQTEVTYPVDNFQIAKLFHDVPPEKQQTTYNLVAVVVRLSFQNILTLL
jgi:hypothetical protein